MKTEWAEKERFDLCAKLEGIFGADLDLDEYDAIFNAISIISPAYAEAIEKEEKEFVKTAEDVLREMEEKRKAKYDNVLQLY